MSKMNFSEAVDSALAQAMAEDSRIIVFGEDTHTLRLNLRARFGEQRVRSTPISESAFLGAAVGAAMAGLRPVVEIMIIDFIAVAASALLNEAAKIEAFSGGRWNVPLVIRSACGGGYGDGGQHEQSLWGWLAHIPGLQIVVPSNPADAGGLFLGSLSTSFSRTTGWSSWAEEAEQRFDSMYRRREPEHTCPGVGTRSPPEELPWSGRETISPWSAWPWECIAASRQQKYSPKMA